MIFVSPFLTSLNIDMIVSRSIHIATVDNFILLMGLPLWINDKESACNAEDTGSIPGSGMATHSSTLAWKIPWMEEPGRL